MMMKTYVGTEWAKTVEFVAREVLNIDVYITPRLWNNDTGQVEVYSKTLGSVKYPIRLKANNTICMVQVEIGKDTTWVQVNASPEKFMAFLASNIAKKVMAEYA